LVGKNNISCLAHHTAEACADAYIRGLPASPAIRTNGPLLQLTITFYYKGAIGMIIKIFKNKYFSLISAILFALIVLIGAILTFCSWTRQNIEGPLIFFGIVFLFATMIMVTIFRKQFKNKIKST
jgi:hypothetical protein